MALSCLSSPTGVSKREWNKSTTKHTKYTKKSVGVLDLRKFAIFAKGCQIFVYFACFVVKTSMFERIKQIILKEFILAFRDPKNRFLMFGPPLIQLMMFGYVATTDVNNVTTALYDLDYSQQSRELVRRLEASGYFTIKYLPESPAAMQELMDQGRILCAIQINKGFGRDIQTGTPTALQVLFDGTDSNTATLAMNYATQIIAQYSQELVPKSQMPTLATIEFRPRVWYNPELKSRNFYIPGVIAFIILLTCLMLTSIAIVRERETGTMEQLMVTPIRPLELILGKTLPFGLISFAQMVFITIVGGLWFHVPIVGSLWLLALGTVLYVWSTLGIGLFISTITKNHQQAVMTTMLFNMPALMLSGFIFPIDSMPKIFQYFTYINPLRYFLVIIRGIFLKGNGFDILWPQMAALAVLGLAIVTISALRFQKRLS